MEYVKAVFLSTTYVQDISMYLYYESVEKPLAETGAPLSYVYKHTKQREGSCPKELLVGFRKVLFSSVSGVEVNMVSLSPSLSFFVCLVFLNSNAIAMHGSFPSSEMALHMFSFPW